MAMAVAVASASPLVAQNTTTTEPKSDVIKLSPFEVSTNKDVGYAAGNTLSGGRVDTPLAITPGSISVMTKEFLDDFNITNINQAGNWSIGFDLGTAVPNSDPLAPSSYQAIFRGAPQDTNFPQRNGSVFFGIADIYNTERFEFNRGPDTSMFGDGGPGGRQSSSSKRARFNSTATSLTAAVDTYAGHRGTLDYSIGFDRFGIRVNWVHQNDKAYQRSIDRIKAGITVNAVVKLTDKTTFIAEVERIKERNNLYSITLGDDQQFWDGVTVNADNSPIAGNNSAALTALGIAAVSTTVDYLVWNFGSNGLYNYKGNQYRSTGTNFRIPWTGNPYIPPAKDRSFLSGVSRRLTVAPNDNYADRTMNLLSYTVEHRIGNLFLQAGWVMNDYDVQTRYSNISPNRYDLDLNKLLPDGKPNPSFGKGYTDVGQSRVYSEDGMRELKGLATYRFFVPSFFDYKQQLSLTVGERKTHGEAMTDTLRWVNNPLVADPYNSANILRYRVYWNDPLPSIGKIFSNPDALAAGYKFVNVQDSGSIVKRKIVYGGLISQSTFFDDKVAITASIRRDDLSLDYLPRFGADANYKNVLGNGAPGVHVKRDKALVSTSYGLVAYPFPKSNKWLAPIGFVFNYAENNQPPVAATQVPLVSGDLPPLTHAKTMDFGVRYSVADGKAYLTLTHYNTDQQDIINTFGNLGDIQTIWTNLGYTDPKLTTGAFNYSDVSARKLEGWEVELTANPTANLTLFANYSHPLVFIEEESIDRKAYVAAHMAEWKAGAAAAAGTVINGKTILNPALISQAILNIENSLNGLSTGTIADQTARHRLNFGGSYHFREGALKGLSFNAGANYRGITKNGSRDARIKFGLPDSATPTPAQNVAAAFDYLYVPEQWLVSAGVNYTHKFGKYITRYQINVTNLLDHDTPIWGRSGPSGAYNVITQNQLRNGNPRMQVLSGFVQNDPRKITFTTSLSF